MQADPGPLKTVVARGWHPWYELKVDPENPANLMACGSVWDANRNSLAGFIYISSDAGRTWRTAFVDQETAWVSEQSCAFGPRDTAYFVSEASATIDGEGHHHQGRTRIFTSVDAGQNWTKSAETAWADWSTSVVRPKTGELLIFFNDASSASPEKKQGNSVGLLVFSPSAKHLFGPFADPEMKSRRYLGVYPSDPLCLKDGTVVTLFEGYSRTKGRWELGLERVGPGWPPKPEAEVIVASSFDRAERCAELGDSALGYDETHERLFLLSRKRTEQGCREVLSSSEDGGRSWNEVTPVVFSDGRNFGGSHTSIAVGKDGGVRLLWREEHDWLFARLSQSGMVVKPAIVDAVESTDGILGDSLWSIFHPVGGAGEDSIGLNVRTLPGEIWKGDGLVATPQGFAALVLGLASGEEKLYSLALPEDLRASGAKRPKSMETEVDVTKQVALVFGRGQSFNNATGTLSVEIRLGNRGDVPIRTPVRLEVVRISSKVGRVSILNADNGKKGEGAVWSLSSIIVGDQLLPSSTTYNTATLLFRIEPIKTGLVRSDSLVSFDVHVISGAKPETHSSEDSAK